MSNKKGDLRANNNTVEMWTGQEWYTIDRVPFGENEMQMFSRLQKVSDEIEGLEASGELITVAGACLTEHEYIIGKLARFRAIIRGDIFPRLNTDNALGEKE